MVTLLSKLFIKNAADMSPDKMRSAYGTLCCCLGICLNIILFGFKYFAGVLSGSIAITADAFNNLTDAGSSVITLAGIRLAGRKPDPEHPFGHGRIEYISALAVSVIIVVVGVELFRSSVDKIMNPADVDRSIIAKSVASKNGYEPKPKIRMTAPVRGGATITPIYANAICEPIIDCDTSRPKLYGVRCIKFG